MIVDMRQWAPVATSCHPSWWQSGQAYAGSPSGPSTTGLTYGQMLTKNAQHDSKQKMLISTNTSMLYFLVVEAVTAGNSLSEDKEWRLEEDSLGGCSR